MDIIEGVKGENNNKSMPVKEGGKGKKNKNKEVEMKIYGWI